MSNFGTDPFGTRFFNNRNRRDEEQEEEEASSSTGPSNNNIAYYYYPAPGYHMVPPSPQMYFTYTTNMFSPYMHHPYMVQNPQMIPVAVAPSSPPPSQHVTCTRNNRCNRCNRCRQEDATDERTFWNPRRR